MNKEDHYVLQEKEQEMAYQYCKMTEIMDMGFRMADSAIQVFSKSTCTVQVFFFPLPKNTPDFDLYTSHL